MFRLLSRQAFKAICRPGLHLSNGTASRQIHSVQPPYTGPLSNNTTEQSDAILVGVVEIRNTGEMKEEGREVLQQPLNKGLDGKEIYSHRRGLNLAAELIRMRQSINSLERDKIQQDLKIASLEDQVSYLTLVSEEYNLLRQRFLSIYKRKVNKCTTKDWSIIQAGNTVAHGGDAIADARLYLSGSRRDTGVFRELYGLDTTVVPSLGLEIISILNLHATMLADEHKTGSNEFYDLFNKFIQLFMESDFDETFLTSDGGELEEVYNALIACRRYKSTS